MIFIASLAIQIQRKENKKKKKHINRRGIIELCNTTAEIKIYERAL